MLYTCKKPGMNKTGKEIKTNDFKNYNVVYGSVNGKTPKACYINITSWANPNNDGESNYNRIIRDLDKRIRQTVYDYLTEHVPTQFLVNRTIVDFDIKKSGVRYGKRSFTNCEITLYLSNTELLDIDISRLELSKLINIVIESVFERCRHFKFHKKKI